MHSSLKILINNIYNIQQKFTTVGDHSFLLSDDDWILSSNKITVYTQNSIEKAISTNYIYKLSQVEPSSIPYSFRLLLLTNTIA